MLGRRAWLLVSVATGCMASPRVPVAAPTIADVAPVVAPPPPEQPPAPPAAPSRSPLAWVGGEGGAAGFIPVEDSAITTFHGVSDAKGVRSVLARYPRVTITINATDLCRAADALAEARGRVSVDIGIMEEVSSDTARCVETIRPVALSLYASSKGGPPSAGLTAILQHLEGCEALGIAYADDAVARKVGDVTSNSLVSVNLTMSQLGPEAFTALAKRRSLRAIGLRGMHAPQRGSSSGLAALATLPDLERLDLSYGPVTDDDFTAFAAAAHLRWVSLEVTKVTDRGAAAFAHMRELESLNLGASEIGDGALAAVAQLPRLQKLLLTRTHVTDSGVAMLAGARRLAHLDLAQTAVTDASLPVLGSLPALRVLELPSTMSPAAVARFKVAHPDLKVDCYP